MSEVAEDIHARSHKRVVVRVPEEDSERLGEMKFDRHEISKRMTRTKKALSRPDRRDERPDRIGKWLELRELAKAQAGFDHIT